jgi:hypothetical protein
MQGIRSNPLEDVILFPILGILPARFRTGAYDWKASHPGWRANVFARPSPRSNKVAKKEPALGAEGAVRLMEKLWPAPQHVDSSSGAMGSAVNKALDVLIPVIVKVPAEDKTRNKWLDRHWQVMADDGVDYLSSVGDRWGEICGSVKAAGQWADELISTLLASRSDPNPGAHFHGAMACLTCIWWRVDTRELLELLELPRYPSWHYRRYGVEALLRLEQEGGSCPLYRGLAGIESA